MITLDGNNLTLDQIISTARKYEKVCLSKDSIQRTRESYTNVLKIFSGSLPVYGINTGFGSFSDETISIEDSKRLNRNLILSHAVGTGDPLPLEGVRAAMLIRINALAKGFSGINPDLIEVLVSMLNAGVTPVINSKGSLGSSGDLCMLAQMAMVFSKDPDNRSDHHTGTAHYQNQIMSGVDAMSRAGIDRIVLENKDGLALINGATFSAAHMALNCHDGQLLCDLSDIAVSLCLEALGGKSNAFHHLIHDSRGMAGQILSAENIRRVIAGSKIIDSRDQVQDAYSLRCAPQVHGAVRDAVSHSKNIISREINAATDNPLIFDDKTAISGGNFHGEPIGLIADYFKNGISELGAISERRIFRMLDKNLNAGLPPMLVGHDASPGLNSGVMMLQYTAASLVLENQSLCSPDSVRSLPTSANQEDHNANAYIASYHAREILQNTTKVLAIEIFINCRAIKLRLQMNPAYEIGGASEKAFEIINRVAPFHDTDTVWMEQIEDLYELLRTESEFKEELLSLIS